jgi:hypothetical protein
MKNIKRIGKNFLFGRKMRLLVEAQDASIFPETISDARDRATDFVLSMRSKIGPGFCFAPGSTDPDIYSTAYGISYLGLIGRLDLLSADEKDAIASYIDDRQHEDGLFRDPSLSSPLAEDGQGWGWQHLVPHVLIALDYLETKPRQDFTFAFRKFGNQTPDAWLEDIFADDFLTASNHFLNVVVALQYSRDVFKNRAAGELVGHLNTYAVKMLLPRFLEPVSGGGILDRSNRVKTIYHLLPSIIFDAGFDQNLKEQIVALTLKTQNDIGGYGTSLVSDGCEDMDSAFNLAVMRSSCLEDRSLESLRNYLDYVFVNQNKDGGFVFRRLFPFSYGGCPKLSSAEGVSNMFATWFRFLSIAFTIKAMGWEEPDWIFSRVSGYQHFVQR